MSPPIPDADDRDRLPGDNPDDLQRPPDDEEHSPVEPLEESPDDDVLPSSPGRRRLAGTLALLLIVAILAFLVVFIATHTEQATDGAVLGGLVAPPALSLTVA